MNTLSGYGRVLAAMLAVVSMPVWAGVPSYTGIDGTATVTQLVSTALHSDSPTQTLTLTFNSYQAGSGFGSLLNTLSITGANSSDFAIVGGTCTPGSTILSPGNTTCTVTVRYTPSTASPESAQLAGTCSTVGLLGGFTLVCSGASGALGGLVGTLLAALSPAPALDPKLLTALCVLLLGIGAYFAARRKA